jgi:hypothetical protein
MELYLRADGTIAFVMPYAVLNRRQFAGFRTGRFASRSGRRKDAIVVFATARFTDAWAFDESVQPLFPVPACVLFAVRAEPALLPAAITVCTGALPRRDATLEEADRALNCTEAPWPAPVQVTGGSGYRHAFRQGATILPRVLAVVELAPIGLLGMAAEIPHLQSRRSPQEKPPWRDLPPLRGNIEVRFLRPLYMGESLAPYRVLEPARAIIPWDERTNQLLTAAGALERGIVHLYRWLSRAEQLWEAHGKGGMTLLERWDYQRSLSVQLSPAAVRAVYATSGTLPAAAILHDRAGVVDHTLYWLATDDLTEAQYLVAVLNSETVRSRIAAQQARGQWGARHFHKLMFGLSIPNFDPADALHQDLAVAAARAESVAGQVAIGELYFVRARQRIRDALREDGIAQQIDVLVARLLNGRAD